MTHRTTAIRIAVRISVFMLLACGALRILLPTLAFMSSNSYIIQMGNINMTSGTKSSASYQVTDTVGQNAPGQFSSSSYYVKAGFQYIYTIGKFKFMLSNSAVNFGSLTPNQFSTGSTIVTISAKGAGGYNVTTSENHKLRTAGATASIPDTTCDSGTCTETAAAVWSTPSNNGFGYNVTGNDIPAAFVDATYFKQFADISANKAAQIIMSNSGVAFNRQATVTYQVSVAGSQGAGNYENSITYIAIPGY
ncbi:MAG TPA: hypothetical protein VFG51_01560 [Candidatus Saccharimonadia bacterium]|nr:hypothetical protein [Candidatus Saccharimonadia bacterium]